MNSLCSHERLELALAGSLNADDEATLHLHLEACESCFAEMARLAGGEQASREIAAMLIPDDFYNTAPLREECSTADFVVDHLEPSDDPAVLGRLGGYDVLDIIGRGGMGVVLKGFDRELKRFVAIKALAPHLAHSALARKRFAREAQAAAAVVNLHVIAIHQVQPNGQLPFLVMPLLTGESLAQRLKARGTLELKEILRIGMQAAEGLAAAHGQGLIHRDVKPANILLEKGVERAVLTDFGLARAADDISMTRLGVIAGTPEYMSPEQARGEALDGRSDLFSLGCVLYEMATGVSPFRTDSTMATLRRIVDEQPAAMASLVPELPPWFCHIVERLLSKDPAQRFASASEVSRLLEQCLSHLQQPTSVPLPASLVPHAAGRRSIFKVTREAMTTNLYAEKNGVRQLLWLRIILFSAIAPGSLALIAIPFVGWSNGAFWMMAAIAWGAFAGGLVGAAKSVPLEQQAAPRSDCLPNQIDGEPRIPWYWAVALLIPIGVVVVGSTFAVLLLYYGGKQPLPPEARIPVIMAFPISAIASFLLWRWALQSLLMRLARWYQPTSIPLSASLVTHAAGRRSIFTVSRKGVLAMLGTIGMTLLGMVLWQATEAPDISGQWASDEWGTVFLEEKQPGRYQGTMTNSSLEVDPYPVQTGKTGKIELEWSRLERRFNGTFHQTWDQPWNLSGKLSIRLVDNEIRGAWSTEKDAPTESGKSRLADLLWKRSVVTVPDGGTVLLEGLKRTNEAAKSPSGLAEMKERRDVLFQRVALLEKQLALGETDPATVLTARDQLFQAELRLVTTKEERLTIYQKRLESMRAIEKFVKKIFDNEESSQVAMLAATAARLQAEIDLAQAGETVPGIEKLLDRQNARAVAEAYFAAAIAGRIDEATSLTKFALEDRPAARRATEENSRWLNDQLKVPRLDLKSVYVDDPEKPVVALATTEAMRFANQRLDSEREVLLVAFVMSKEGWLLSLGEPYSEQSADRELKKFLEANPKSISVPPLTKRPASNQFHDLQGVWEYISVEADGVVTEYKIPVSSEVLSITDNLWKMNSLMGSVNRVEIDGRNLTFHGKTSSGSASGVGGDVPSIAYGIYTLDDDSLGFCMTPFVPSSQVGTGADAFGEPVIKHPQKFETKGTQNRAYRLRRSAAKVSAIEQPLDRQNARAVVEAYIALALLGDVAKAAALAKNSPAHPKRIEEIPKTLNVQRLKIEAVYVIDPAKPTQALAISAAVKLDEDHKQPNGCLVFTLELTDGKWFVIDIDFRGTRGP